MELEMETICSKPYCDGSRKYLEIPYMGTILSGSNRVNSVLGTSSAV
jgi:hypothetical protein